MAPRAAHRAIAAERYGIECCVGCGAESRCRQSRFRFGPPSRGRRLVARARLTPAGGRRGIA